MTADILVIIVIIVIVGLMLIRLALDFYGPQNSRKSDRKKLNLDRFLLVRHDQVLAVDDGVFKFSANADSHLTMTFDQLARLAVITTDQGPWLDDAFLALDFIDGQAWLLPSEHPHYARVYEALSAHLPLDYEQYIAAMASTDHAEFIIWMRPLENAD